MLEDPGVPQLQATRNLSAVERAPEARELMADSREIRSWTIRPPRTDGPDALEGEEFDEVVDALEQAQEVRTRSRVTLFGEGQGAPAGASGPDAGSSTSQDLVRTLLGVEATSARVLAQMRKGIVEFCVLAHLRAGASYGREIATRLASDPAVLTSEGTLYPLLARLRKQGWVETSWTASDTGPPRRYYTPTDDGGAALEAFTDAWGPFTTAVNAILKAEG